ncbi:hypothetical protein N3K66_002727 [Trichothecium roseum]|uniref:Uncharacterized protein n=1 Tax=Trichothecium roseum TaxID=47278 RepID=A0ACC0VC12_9HYPO|nr:hypothetical protein N3K66_002727 [Trichothecium roseum]
MASVTSLDKDLRRVRLEKFTPAAANEVRDWIEEVLGERFSSGDLLESLKDGVALCKLVNLAVPPPGVRFKQSAMPFVQMENISIFLRACQAPPLNLHQHDTFLTVDLFEQKDPAQVLQCLGAFSRAANAANPSKFPRALGPKTRGGGGGVVSPQATGPAAVPSSSSGLRGRGASITSNTSSGYGGQKTLLASRTGDSASGRRSPTKSPASDGTPAWNIAQYGYMGGASQGNLGIVYGARRQITNTGPKVPSLADKERMRKEEEDRLHQEAEEEERRHRADQEAAERRAQADEQQKWEDETRRLRNEERRKADDEKRRWEEEERQWKLTEERRRKEEEAAEARMEEERKRARGRSDVKLQGQFLSQYQSDQGQAVAAGEEEYKSRIEQLEKELEKARQREADYEKERVSRGSRPPVEAEVTANRKSKSRSRSRAAALRAASSAPSRQDSWSKDEREVLRTSWNQHRSPPQSSSSSAHEPHSSPPVKSPRPLPDPTAAASNKPLSPGGGGAAAASARPLPDPAKYSSPPRSRTDRFLASNPAPAPPKPQQTYSRELDATSERDAEDRRRQQTATKAAAGGWASKSLLEREMEMERQRQREWEEAQQETAANAAARPAGAGDGVDGIGGRWDVGQWSGYTGGDGQNKGSQGIGAGRRQIVGPRPLPGNN